jgi:Putative transposase
VLEYLGRYMHRVAIANSRLVDFSDASVTFRWKDYRHENKPKVMRLPAQEFTRRFLLHVLPAGLQRIRHYGLLANRTRDAKLERCRELLGVVPPPPNEQTPEENYRDRYLRLTGVSLVDCPACKRGRMVCIETLPPRPPSQGPPHRCP